jgi:hypothetical protein
MWLPLHHKGYSLFLFLFPFKHFEMHREYLLLMLLYRLFWELVYPYLHFLQVQAIGGLPRGGILPFDFLQNVLVCSHVPPVEFQSISRLSARLPRINPCRRRDVAQRLIVRNSQLTKIRFAFLQPMLPIILLPNQLIRNSQNDQGPPFSLYGIYNLMWCHRSRVYFWLVRHYLQPIFGATLGF